MYQLSREPYSLVPIDKTGDSALDIGGAIHQILELFYNTKIAMLKGEMQMSYWDNVEMCIAFAQKEIANKLYEPASFDIILKAFRDYAAFYEDDNWIPIVVEAPFSKIILERPETNEKEGLIVLWEGKIDLLVELQGTRYVTDHKSMAKRTEPNPLSLAFKGYCWVMGTNNIIQNSVGLQKTLPPERKFLREIISYPTAIIDEFVRWVHYYSQQIDEHIQAGLYPPNNTNCYRCNLREICIAEPDAREWKIKTRYRQTSRKALFEEINDTRDQTEESVVSPNSD